MLLSGVITTTFTGSIPTTSLIAPLSVKRGQFTLTQIFSRHDPISISIERIRVKVNYLI